MNTIYIGKDEITDVYVGQTIVDQIYVGTTLMFSRLCSVGFTLDSTVDRVVCTYVDPWGESHTETIKSSIHLYVPFGSSLSLTAYPKAGYSMQSYTDSVDIVDSDSLLLNFTTTTNSYVVNVNLCSADGTEYGHTYGERFGTFKYSWDNATWNGDVSDLYTSAVHGSTLYIKEIFSAPGWFPDTIQGEAYEPKTYSFTVNANNLVINIKFRASVSNSRFSASLSQTFTNNSIDKTGFNVSARASCRIPACTAGTVLATIPNSMYRPNANVTVSSPWRQSKGDNSTTINTIETANITIDTNGNVTSDKDATGAGSGGGGKGTTGASWWNLISFSTSWSTE